MKRKVHINDATNVNLYGTEAGPNGGNCASGCVNCSNGGNDDGGKSSALVTALITATAIIVAAALASDPDTPISY